MGLLPSEVADAGTPGLLDRIPAKAGDVVPHPSLRPWFRSEALELAAGNFTALASQSRLAVQMNASCITAIC